VFPDNSFLVFKSIERSSSILSFLSFIINMPVRSHAAHGARRFSSLDGAEVFYASYTFINLFVVSYIKSNDQNRTVNPSFRPPEGAQLKRPRSTLIIDPAPPLRAGVHNHRWLALPVLVKGDQMNGLPTE